MTLSRKQICLYILAGLTLLLSLANIGFAGNFNNVLEQSVTTDSTPNQFRNLVEVFQSPAGFDDQTGEDALRNFIARAATQILIPVFVRGGIILAIVWFYKLMSKDTEEEQKLWFRYLLWWVLGVIIMVSAGYMADQLVGERGITNIIGEIGAVWGNNAPAGAVVASQIYVNVIFPFIKLFLFLVLGVLFILALVHGFKYIFKGDEAIQKKSLTLLLYNALGIIVVILAKTMVEAVYGPYSEVVNSQVKAGGNDVGSIGDGTFEDPVTQFSEVGGLYSAVNRILGLTAFIIVTIVIYQGYVLLTNPTSEETMAKLKKNLLYIFVGIVIIGAGYLLTNFFIIQ